MSDHASASSSRPNPTVSLARSSRRGFLGRLAGGALAPAVLPVFPLLDQATRSRSAPPGLPLPATPAGEEYWELVRAQFTLRPGLIYLNAANLCPSPFPVSDAVTSYTRDVDSDPSFQNRAKFSAMHERTLEALAAFVGAGADEIVITRNTSESNNTVLNGLTLGRGDEVVIWDQNHPTNNIAWDVRAERYGFTVKRVTTPAQPQAGSDLIQPFLAALGPRTRVLAVTHISSGSGVALPAAELCAAARERNILSLVDGAQAFGCVKLELHALGCDFYTASAHKWFMGPKEAGLLYVRKELAPAIWPSVVGIGWDTAKDRGARRFSTLGQRDDAALVAMGAAVDFHNRIGRELVEQRIRDLAATLKREIAARVAGVQFHTPLDASMSGGVVIIGVPGIQPRAGYEALYQKSAIAGASSGGSFPGIRLCPHVYTTVADVQKAAVAVAALRAA
jgi:selenocysteine lyase/cysteine desulfurase